MRVRLKGIASATKVLADGTRRKYYYAWRGGPLLPGEPGSAEFMAAYNEAVASRRKAPEGTLFTLIAEYKASTDFTAKSDASKRNYRLYLKLIEDKFGKMPLAVLEDPRIRGDFKDWRDSFAATPRKADYAWTTLARVLSHAKDRGRIKTNPCERGGRLYASDRAEKIWSDAQIERLLKAAPDFMRTPIMLALWTGQRQGDLLRLPWSAYDGDYIRLQQSKTKARVEIRVGAPLKAVLDELKKTKKSPTILLNSRGQVWTSDGFRTSWADLVDRAGLADADRTFHDFRGTAVTRLALAGSNAIQIANITGHALNDVNQILDAHYLAKDRRLGDAAILKLEKLTLG